MKSFRRLPWSMRWAVAALILLPFVTAPARAADICEAIATRNVAAVEAPGSVIKKGEKDTAITQYNVSKKTGQGVFCSHGGYCYPADGLKLLNCKIGAKDSYNDPDEVSYGLDVIRSKNSSASLRYDDLDNQLLEMGMCSACASNAADTYIKRPGSPCGKTIKRALEGNPVAKKELANGDACN